jgi:hypothetical protein
MTRNISPRSTSTGQSAALGRIRLLTKVLDEAIAIPGTGRKVGLDPIIGLLTGGGDSVGMVMSVYILLESLRFGLPKATLTRMLANVAADSLIGTVPFLGDIFDFVWGANSKNLKLLEAHIANPGLHTPADTKFVLFILVGLAAIILVAIAIGVLVAGTFVGALRLLTGS